MLKVEDKDNYEWETHIFFDDAFKKGPADSPLDKPVIDLNEISSNICRYDFYIYLVLLLILV